MIVILTLIFISNSSDEISPEILSKAKFIVLGRHIPSNPIIPAENVIKAYSGRFINPRENEKKVKIEFEAATSIASLVANEITANTEVHQQFPRDLALYLLAAPIIVYADNMNNGQGSELDRKMITELSKKFGWDAARRTKHYDEIRYLQNDYRGVHIEEKGALFKNIDIISTKDRSLRLALIQIPTDLQVN